MIEVRIILPNFEHTFDVIEMEENIEYFPIGIFCSNPPSIIKGTSVKLTTSTKEVFIFTNVVIISDGTGLILTTRRKDANSKIPVRPGIEVVYLVRFGRHRIVFTDRDEAKKFCSILDYLNVDYNDKIPECPVFITREAALSTLEIEADEYNGRTPVAE